MPGTPAPPTPPPRPGPKNIFALAALIGFSLLYCHGIAWAEEEKKDGPEKVKGRMEWFYGRRAGPDGSFPLGARQKGISAAGQLPLSPLQQRKQRGLSPLSGAIQIKTITVPWTIVSPQGLLSVGNWSPSSLKVNAIAVHPHDPQTVYIGTSFGGIAKSIDGGGNWSYVSDDLPSQEISSIVIDTTAPNIVYAGSGDRYYQGHGNTLLGVGVYRSIDSGAHWDLRGQNEFNGSVISQILTDPPTSGSQTQSLLYAAVSAGPAFGIWKSNDSGSTWAKTWSIGTLDLAMDLTNPSVLYGASGGIVKSVDAGQTWTALHAFLDPANPTRDFLNGSTHVIWAGGVLFVTTYANSGMLLKSTDGGASWTQLPAANGFCGAQCSYDSYVAVNPFGIYKIFLGGQTKALISYNNGGAFFSFGTDQLHADHHAMAYAPSDPNIIYEANDGGIYKSIYGGGENTWRSLNGTLPGALILGASVSGDGHMVMGCQDNGTFLFNADPNSGWNQSFGMFGDGGFAKIDAGNSQKMYSTFVGAPNESTIYRIDGYNTTPITPRDTFNNADFTDDEDSLFYPPLFVKPEEANRVIVGFNNIWRSVDSGGTWTRIGRITQKDPNLGWYFDVVSAIAEAPSDNQVIYAANDAGLSVTSDAGSGTSAAWTRKNNGLPLDGQGNVTQMITAIAIHPQLPGTAYLTLSQYGSAGAPLSHVYKTVDMGDHWTNASAGLPDVPFNDIIIDTASPSHVFAASDVGVFNSMDGGATWNRMDAGMPRGQIANSLSLNTGTRQLVVGTYGRGAYSMILPTVPPPPSGLAISGRSNSSIQWTWAAAPAQFDVQAYGVYYATNPTVLAWSGPGTSYTWSNLQANTAYSIAVTAANGISESVNSAPVPASTLANAPAAARSTSVNLSSMSVNWSANGNPAWTYYLAQISTDNFATLNFSSRTLNVSTTFFALAANTSYDLRVKALNNDDLPTAPVTIPSVATRLATPLAAAPSGIGGYQATVNWGANGNSPATVYTAQISTDNFATLNESKQTTNTQALFSNLLPATAYATRVSALGLDGNSSPRTSLPAFTTLNIVAPLAAPFTNATQNAIRMNWLQGANPPGQTYSADIAAAADFSSILDNTQGVDLFSAAFNGLSVNTTYYFRAHVLGGPYLIADPVATNANAPASAAPSGITISQAAANWLANGDPAGTHYVAQISTDNFATLNDSKQTDNVQFVFSALAANTRYYTRVRAISHNGASTAQTALPTLVTLALPVGAPTVTAHISSFTVSYPACAVSACSGYTLQASLVSDFSGALISSSTPNAALASLQVYGLNSLTDYYLRLATLNSASNPNFTSLGSFRTLDDRVLPLAAPFTNISQNAIQMNWLQGTNKPGRTYSADISADAGFSSILGNAQGVDSFSASFGGLAVNTTYYFRVHVLGGPYLVEDPVATLAATPGLETPVFSTVAASQLRVNWADGGNPSGTLYLGQVSALQDFSAAVSSQTRNLSSDFTGLAANTTYYARVAAVNHGGTSTSFLALLATSTLANTPAAAPFPYVAYTTVTVAWTPFAASPQSAAAEGFHIEASTDARFYGTLFSSVCAGGESRADLTGLSLDTSYYFRVGALNWNSALNFTNFGIMKTSSPVLGSSIGDSGVVLNIIPPFTQLNSINISVDPGVFPAGTPVTLDTIVDLPQARTNEAEIASLGAGVGFNLSASGLQPARRVRAVLGYEPSRLPAGSNPKTIQLARYDDSAGQWSLLPTTVDTSQKKITGFLDHFSIFAPFFVTPASSLDSVNIFPIPWEPGSSNASFNAQALTISNLPSPAKVRLFTITGELIWEGDASGAGVVNWFGDNRFGRMVGSGTYLAVIEGGGRRTTRRVVIIR